MIMRKLCFPLILLLVSNLLNAQKKQNVKVDLSGRPNDHFMFQLTGDGWVNAPDSISNHIKGLNRGLNVYVMLDKPFKSNPKLSVGIGAGISNSGIFFEHMKIDVTGTNSQLVFQHTGPLVSFKKYKLNTSYLELPLELRFSSKPATPNKSAKVAIGAKIGTLVNVHTKAKFEKNALGEIIVDGITKESSKKYFNNTRLAVTARVNYGIFGIIASYSLTPLLKNGVGSQDIRQLQIGLNLSGL